MRLVLPLAVLAAAVVVLLLAPADATIAGLDRREVAGVAALVALLAYYLANARRSDVARMVSSLAVWAMLFALLAVLAYRYDAGDFIDRMTAELMPSEPSSARAARRSSAKG